MMKPQTLLSFLFLSVLLFSVPSLSQASFLRISYDSIEGEILTEGFKLTHVQPKLKCHFRHSSNGSDLIRRRYPGAHVTQLGEQVFDINLRSSSLTEWLPRYDVLSCGYVLIVLGQLDNGRAVLGDLVFMGKTFGEMPPEELEFMLDSKKAHSFLTKLYNPLQLYINDKGRIDYVRP